MMEWMADPTVWLGLATLVILEIVLGIDNLIFIAILADKLPPAERDRARIIGLTPAMLMRLALLASISWLVTDTADSDAPSVVQEQEGVWLLDGSLSLEELRDLLQSENLPREAGYHTLAGLVLNQLGQIPNGGEQFALEGYQFEVVSMDGHRIQQVRVRCGGAEGPRHA